MRFHAEIASTTEWPDASHFDRASESFASFEGQAANYVPAFPEIWQQLVDGLTEQVALLDEDWNILVCNNAWTRAVEHYGQFALAPGANYLAFIRLHAAEGDIPACDTLSGLTEIIAGKRSSYRMIYHGIDHWTGRDIEVSIRQLEVNGQKFASVTRYDVSKLLELRKLRQEFSNSVMHEQGEERRRIGREIHDSTVQLLASVGMMIGALKRTALSRRSRPVLDEMAELLGQAQNEIRSISYLIHPPALGELPVQEALRALVDGFGRRTGLDVRFDVVSEPRFCCPAAEVAIYRVVQEALSNVHRHAKARNVSVQLRQGRSATHILISDDGVGMPSAVRPGVGLPGMQARLAELGGRLSILRRPTGTAVIASIPSRELIAN